MDDFEAMRGHERMKEAFLATGTSQTSGNKYIEVWEVFGHAAKSLDGSKREQRINVVKKIVETKKSFQLG